ncbi:MAG: class I SAM-dependent methyltransferase [Acetobacterium sp.]|nr:class I SAM-dependent methyltransferase [Acetobacterium sp.]
MKKEIFNKQNCHWEDTFARKPQMFGTDPSIAAIKAVEIFKNNGVRRILELGGGQGRDTLYFAQQGFAVTVIEYTVAGIQAIRERAKELEVDYLVTTLQHDVRQVFPFATGSFDACYSHMLYCMALTTSELTAISAETNRVLKPGGIAIYTARNTDDADCGTGTHHGEDIYECGKFIIHFFSKEKVETLAEGFEIIDIDNFEEGALPRKLFFVVQKKLEDGKADAAKSSC